MKILLLVLPLMLCMAFSCDSYQANKKFLADKLVIAGAKEIYPKYCVNKSAVEGRLKGIVYKALRVQEEQRTKSLGVVCAPVASFIIGNIEKVLITPEMECTTDSFANMKKDLVVKVVATCDAALLAISKK